MRVLILGFILLGFYSCAMPEQKHRVIIEKASTAKPLTRSDKYKACIIDFSREGIKQSLIKDLCDGTYGSLD